MVPLCLLAARMLSYPVLRQSRGGPAGSVRENGSADEAVVRDELRIGVKWSEGGRWSQERSVEFEMADRGVLRSLAR